MKYIFQIAAFTLVTLLVVTEPCAAVFQLSDEPVKEFEFSGFVYSVQFHRDDPNLMIVGEDKQLHEYDLSTNTSRWSLRRSGAIGGIAFSPDGTRVVVTSGPDLEIYDVHSKALILSKQLRTNHYGGLDAVQFSRDGRYLAVSNVAGGDVTLFDSETLIEIRKFWGLRTGGIDQIRIDNSGRYIYGGGFYNIYMWDILSGELIADLSRVNTHGRSFDFSNDLQYIVGTMERDIELIDVETKQIVARFKGHESPVDAVLFSPDHCCVISAGGESGAKDSIRVWKIADQKQIQEIQLDTNAIMGMTFNQVGGYLAVFGIDFVKIFSVGY